jgi:hypothetical protein
LVYHNLFPFIQLKYRLAQKRVCGICFEKHSGIRTTE